MRFDKDVVIDLVCYRRHGHNEADEPAATQPIDVQGDPQASDAAPALRARSWWREGAGQRRRGASDGRGLSRRPGRGPGPVAASSLGMIGNEYTVDWTRLYDRGLGRSRSRRRLPSARLAELGGRRSAAVPDDVKLHPRVERIMDDRRRMAAGEIPLDWGFAETMAYASC